MSTNRQRFNKLCAICFIAVLALVFLGNLFMKDRSFSSEENRVLQEMPRLSPSLYLSGRYETKLDSYVNDQFIFRDRLIRVKAAQDMTLGALVSNGVIRGKDHYLMEELAVPGRSFQETQAAVLAFRKKYPGKRMYFLLAPNAANILSDKLPAAVQVADQNGAMDAFFRQLRKSSITPLDVRTPLQEAAKSTQVYYRTDHHWTTEGAYAAYKSILSAMKITDTVRYDRETVKNDFRGTLASKSGFPNGLNDSITIFLPRDHTGARNSIFFFSDTKEKTTDFYQLKHLSEKDAYQVFGGGNHPSYTVETPRRNGRVLLLLKDSYANCFVPLLAQDFRKIIVVDPRYYFGNLNTLMTSQGVTDVLFLYNANTLFQDTALKMALAG